MMEIDTEGNEKVSFRFTYQGGDKSYIVGLNTQKVSSEKEVL